MIGKKRILVYIGCICPFELNYICVMNAAWFELREIRFYIWPKEISTPAETGRHLSAYLSFSRHQYIHIRKQNKCASIKYNWPFWKCFQVVTLKSETGHWMGENNHSANVPEGRFNWLFMDYGNLKVTPTDPQLETFQNAWKISIQIYWI